MVAIIESSGGGYTIRGSGFSFLGVVGSSATAGGAGFVNTNSGGISANAGGSWTDGISVTWPERFSVTGVQTLRLNFNISATGSVSATKTMQDSFTLASSGAQIGYNFNIAGTTFSGSQSVSAGNPIQTTGAWGTIAGSINLTATAAGGGTYTFNGISLAMSGSASAIMQNLFNGSSTPRNAVGTGEFGSTLIWQGIADAQAFDSNGAEITLPDDFEVQLAGNQTGFNYWNAAPVPEPSTWGLLVTGGLVISAAVRRRKR